VCFRVVGGFSRWLWCGVVCVGGLGCFSLVVWVGVLGFVWCVLWLVLVVGFVSFSFWLVARNLLLFPLSPFPISSWSAWTSWSASPPRWEFLSGRSFRCATHFKTFCILCVIYGSSPFWPPLTTVLGAFLSPLTISAELGQVIFCPRCLRFFEREEGSSSSLFVRIDFEGFQSLRW